MGWCDPEVEGHEGYVVGLVDVGTNGWKRWRELRYPEDKEAPAAPIEMLQAACDCGWRSRRFHAPIINPPKWAPYMVLVDEETEEGALVLWREHVRAEATRPDLAVNLRRVAIDARAKAGARS